MPAPPKNRCRPHRLLQPLDGAGQVAGSSVAFQPGSPGIVVEKTVFGGRFIVPA
jgi:hypothetical protein